MKKKILVDNNETTLREFIHDNTEQEGQIELIDILRVINAKQGDKLHVGMVDIVIL